MSAVININTAISATKYKASNPIAMPSKLAKEKRKATRLLAAKRRVAEQIFRSENKAAIDEELQTHEHMFKLVQSLFAHEHWDIGQRRFRSITTRFRMVEVEGVQFLHPSCIHVDPESRREGQCRLFLLTLLRFTHAITGNSRVMFNFPTRAGRAFFEAMECEGILIKDENHTCRWLSAASYPMGKIIAW